MSTQPSQAPEPAVQPSSTPDGPQVIPTTGTPEGEPGPDPEPDPDSGSDSGAVSSSDPGSDEVTLENRTSTPNSGGPAGLAGDMGISSERTGPEGDDPRDSAMGIAGTGSKGTAVERTDGQFDSSPTEWDAVDVSSPELHPDRAEDLDEEAGAPRSGWRPDAQQNVDRTVGEPRPNPIPDEKLRRQ